MTENVSPALGQDRGYVFTKTQKRKPFITPNELTIRSYNLIVLKCYFDSGCPVAGVDPAEGSTDEDAEGG